MTAAVLIAAAPVTVVAAVAFAGAWLRGWPPARLWRAAAWSLPMTGVYLAGRALHAASWRAWPAPRSVTGSTPGTWPARPGAWRAFVLCAPVAVPAGLAAPRALWAWRIYAIETGLSGRTATAPVVFDARQWRRQARTARARITAPGTVPLTDRRGPGRDGRDHPRHRPPLAPRHHHPVHRDGPASGRHRRVRAAGRRT